MPSYLRPPRSLALLLGLSCGSLFSADAHAVEVVVPTVVSKVPHDTTAFTQGLLFHDGFLYESTGIWGDSSVRRVELETGEVLLQHDLPDEDFGEGLARVDDTLWQLTWQNGIAYRYAIDDFSIIDTAAYEGEGWGLCFDGERLVMSDGSNTLSFRDPETFDLLGTVDVTSDGAGLEDLNELECVGGDVYANVWHSDFVVRIDPETGQVTAEIDAAGLLTEEEYSDADVLNGVAYNPASGNFFFTGKDWPWVFEVDIDGVDAPGGGTSTGGDDDSGSTSTGDGDGESSTGSDAPQGSSSTDPQSEPSSSGDPATGSTGAAADGDNSSGGGCSVGGPGLPYAAFFGLPLLCFARRRRS